MPRTRQTIRRPKVPSLPYNRQVKIPDFLDEFDSDFEIEDVIAWNSSLNFSDEVESQEASEIAQPANDSEIAGPANDSEIAQVGSEIVDNDSEIVEAESVHDEPEVIDISDDESENGSVVYTLEKYAKEYEETKQLQREALAKMVEEIRRKESDPLAKIVEEVRRYESDPLERDLILRIRSLKQFLLLSTYSLD